MSSRDPLSLRIGLAALATIAFAACGDECSVGESPCGDAKGTYVDCDENQSDQITIRTGNRESTSLCPGIDPICEPRGHSQHTCTEGLVTEACAQGVTVLVEDVACQGVAPSTGDLNGDGRTDLLLTCSTWGGGGLWRSLQDTAGHFAAPTKLASASGTEYVEGFVGDVDGDGVADVVATESTGVTMSPPDPPPPSTLVVLLARGDELVRTATSLLSERETVLLLADLDGDGAQEVLLDAVGRIVVLALEGNRLVERDRWDVGEIRSTWHSSVAAADFAGDGHPFVAVQKYDGMQLFAPRDGRYVPAPEITIPMSAVFGDFDGDGATDFAARDPNSVRVMLQVGISNRHGGFAVHTVAPWIGADFWETAELDGQPGLDLAAFSDTGMDVLFNLGKEGAHEPRATTLPAQLSLPLFADVDGDGRADAVAGRSDDTTPAVVAVFGACL